MNITEILEKLDEINDLNLRLKPEDHNEVIIFGSNLGGFHGAGGAGLAFRGEARNTWRKCPIMERAMKRGRGYIGLNAIHGEAKGYQNGLIGASYAICTTVRPGLKKSISLDNIEKQVAILLEFIKTHPEKKFRMTNFGAGLAGYYPHDMEPMWSEILKTRNSEKYEKT